MSVISSKPFLYYTECSKERVMDMKYNLYWLGSKLVAVMIMGTILLSATH